MYRPCAPLETGCGQQTALEKDKRQSGEVCLVFTPLLCALTRWVWSSHDIVRIKNTHFKHSPVQRNNEPWIFLLHPLPHNRKSHEPLPVTSKSRRFAKFTFLFARSREMLTFLIRFADLVLCDAKRVLCSLLFWLSACLFLTGGCP